ncbi:uncharacterized protein BXZ73DRAFT_108096 [Epithele typhae]|uniref:uncharacterized protein n=1 Tax=Epithele typhae TaxID=378194 RepID=UPI002007DFEC|nr:uncharacterized protein BXZ73DRAFT_108096 [Epithele typhae]KAH9911331.1 hypothetical protein BXZ73DRAFT_108096 [Epithele typhae]
MEFNAAGDCLSAHPIDRCPLEIFTAIIQHIVGPASQTDDSSDYSTEWLPLLLVCRWWRDAIVSTKSFWSTIHVHGENGDNWLKLCLERAQGAAIDINIDVENIPHLELTSVLHHAPNIQSLTFHSLLKKHLPELNTFLASGAFPRLTKISARKGWDPAPGMAPIVVPLVLNETNIPRLKTLHLYDLAYVAKPSLFERLEQLSLRPSFSEDDSMEFMEALPAMKRLKSLRLEYLDAEEVFARVSPNPFTLSSLTHLEIPSNTFDLTIFLSYLHIPSATHVKFDYHTEGRVDIQGHEEHTGRRAGIADVLPHPRTNVLPFLPLLSDIAFTIDRGYCRFTASSPGQQHSVDIQYDTETTGIFHEMLCIEPEFQLRDLMDVSRDCPTATRLDISAERLDITTAVWRTLLGQFPLLTELCFEGHGSLASLWAALDPNFNGAPDDRTAALCPALRTIALRDCSVLCSPWEAEAHRGYTAVPRPRLDLSIDALRAMLCARAERSVPIVGFSYVAAPRMEELEEFRTVWRGEHAAALADHVADVSIKTMYKEVDGEDAKASWRSTYGSVRLVHT